MIFFFNQSGFEKIEKVSKGAEKEKNKQTDTELYRLYKSVATKATPGD